MKLTVLVIIFAFIMFFGEKYFAVFRLTENWLNDFKVAYNVKSEDIDDRIVILTITEDTLRMFPYRSPINRSFLADNIEYLLENNVRLIALDILFDQATEKDKDLKLKKVFETSKIPLIIAKGNINSGITQSQIDFLNSYLPKIEKASVVLLRDDKDAVVRKFNSINNGESTFAFEILNKLNSNTNISQGYISFRGKPIDSQYAFKTYPIQTLKLLPKEWFKEKIIFIGADLPHEDRFRTPFSILEDLKTGTMPGVVIHAHIVSSLLEGKYLKEINFIYKYLLFFIMITFGVYLGISNIRSILKAIFSIVFIISYIVIFTFILKYSITPLFTPNLAFLLSLGAGAFISSYKERKEKKFIRDAFSRYLSPSIISEIEKDPKKLQLGGEKKEITIIFTDVAGFTSSSENMEPHILVKTLNEYLTNMTNIIIKYEGTVDKYIGDAIVAFFGAPLKQIDHRERALKCATEMDNYAIEFAKKHEILPFGITRIGVHTGEVTVGNFGSDLRFDYTAIGDAVNTASRLEGVNKYFGTRVCVSEMALKNIHDTIKYRSIGELGLKGKTTLLKVYELCDNNYIDEYSKAYEYLNTNVEEAKRIFKTLKVDDPLVKYHLDRINKGEIGTKIIMEGK